MSNRNLDDATLLRKLEQCDQVYRRKKNHAESLPEGRARAKALVDAELEKKELINASIEASRRGIE